MLWIFIRIASAPARRWSRGDSNRYPHHVFIPRYIKNNHFLSFFFQLQISPTFTNTLGSEPGVTFVGGGGGGSVVERQDSKARDLGFEPNDRHVVALSKKL